jgi:biopolymer transport protein ExbD
MSIAMSGNAEGSHSEINMTPLIDVMLVLLIIFIITIPIQTNAVKIDNPSASLQPPKAPEVIDVAIDFDGTMSWNGVRVNRPLLQSYIASEASKQPQPEVHIKVDRFSRYEVVAQTLADLQRRGLKRIGFANNDYF